MALNCAPPIYWSLLRLPGLVLAGLAFFLARWRLEAAAGGEGAAGSSTGSAGARASIVRRFLLAGWLANSFSAAGGSGSTGDGAVASLAFCGEGSSAFANRGLSAGALKRLLPRDRRRLKPSSARWEKTPWSASALLTSESARRRAAVETLFAAVLERRLRSIAVAAALQTAARASECKFFIDCSMNSACAFNAVASCSEASSRL